MKLFFAAPLSGLPSLLMALPSQASDLHFFMKLFFAAPESALPSLLTAMLSQLAAMAEPTAKDEITRARIIRFIGLSHTLTIKEAFLITARALLYIQSI
jgi:hypothetical protein